jgi:hypothetical protein
MNDTEEGTHVRKRKIEEVGEPLDPAEGLADAIDHDGDDPDDGARPLLLTDVEASGELWSGPRIYNEHVNDLVNIPSGELPPLELVQVCVDSVTHLWLNDISTAEGAENYIDTLLDYFGLQYDQQNFVVRYQPPILCGAESPLVVEGIESALDESLGAQLHVVTLLKSYMMVDMLAIENVGAYQRKSAAALKKVEWQVHNAYRLLQHYFTMEQALRHHRDGPPSKIEIKGLPNFPHLLSGLPTQKVRARNQKRAIVRVLNYLYDRCVAQGLRRHEDKMMHELKIHPHTPKTDANGRLICANCDRHEGHHAQRKQCVFIPAFDIDTSRLIGTFSWMEIESYPVILDWVSAQTSTDNEGIWSAAVGQTEGIAKVLRNAKGERKLPELEYTRPFWISYLNGCFDTENAIFHSYEDMQEEPERFKHIVAFHRPQYFFSDRYVDMLMGPVERGARVAEFPDHLRRRHVRLNRVCRHCERPQDYHADALCTGPLPPVFDADLCKQCSRGEDDCVCGEGMFFPFYIDVLAACRSTYASHYEQILKAQFGHAPDYHVVKFWHYANGGRWLQPNDDAKEDWQVLWSNVGVPQSGKSVVSWTYRQLVPPSLFLPVMNNAQKDFGMENFATEDGKAKLIMLIECAANSKIEPSVIKSCVTGEESVSFNQKNKRMVVFDRWPTRFAEFGNNLMGALDTGGDFSRRWFSFPFQKAVKRRDMKLKNRIKSYELPIINFMACTCYRFAWEMWGSCSIDARCPYRPGRYIIGPTLRNARLSICKEMNPLVSFIENLNSADVPLLLDDRFGDSVSALGPEERPYMPIHEFVDAFLKFRRTRFQQQQEFQNWGPNMYNGVFESYGIEVVKRTMQWKDAPVNTTFLLNIGHLSKWRHIVPLLDASGGGASQRSTSSSSSSSSSAVASVVVAATDQSAWERVLKECHANDIVLDASRLETLLTACRHDASVSTGNDLRELADFMDHERESSGCSK